MKTLLMLLAVLFIYSCNSLALPKSNVQDSIIINDVSGNSRAVNRSNINRGIEAKGANIKDSGMINVSRGNINAVGRSNVNTGIDANGARINNSIIATQSKGNINAYHSNVATGISVDGARNSELSTNFKGNINAAGSNVKIGTISGTANRQKVSTNVGTNVNAAGRTVKIGNVQLNSGYGKPTYKDRHKDVSTGAYTSVGNVYVNGSRTKEVETTVGSGGGYGQRIKVRHKARVHADTGGVDASGTKYTYVSRRQREEAERKQYGSVGNTYTSGQVRKVRTHVDQWIKIIDWFFIYCGAVV